MDTKVDIINFDAYEYFQGMTLYPEKLRTFMKTGGSLAIGIVPTGDTIEGETPEHLYELLMERVNIIASKLRGAGSEDIFDSALLTPGCGTGTMKSEKAELVLKTLKELGELVKLRRTGT
jgi:hypothetical protein